MKGESVHSASSGVDTGQMRGRTKASITPTAIVNTALATTWVTSERRSKLDALRACAAVTHSSSRLPVMRRKSVRNIASTISQA
jgi:hypothetical protein